jgi:uncharacterized protein YcfL
MTRQIAIITLISLLLVSCSSQGESKKDENPVFQTSDGYSDRAPETDLTIPQ